MRRVLTGLVLLSILATSGWTYPLGKRNADKDIDNDRQIVVTPCLFAGINRSSFEASLKTGNERLGEKEQLSLSLLRREPIQREIVQSQCYSLLEAVRGDASKKQVESSSQRGSYLRYLLPVAITLAAGGATYLLYTTRSR